MSSSRTRKPTLQTHLHRDADPRTRDTFRQLEEQLGLSVVMQTERGAHVPIRFNTSLQQVEVYRSNRWVPLGERVGSGTSSTPPSWPHTTVTSIPPHNELMGLQGGSPPGQFYHLSQEQYDGTWRHKLRVVMDAQHLDYGLYSVRQTSLPSTIAGGLYMLHQLPVDQEMQVGFGVDQVYALQDSTDAAPHVVGRYGMAYAGTPGAADYVWRTSVDGHTFTERMRLGGAGLGIGLGGGQPAHALEVRSELNGPHSARLTRVTDVQYDQSPLLLVHETAAANAVGFGSGVTWGIKTADRSEVYPWAQYATVTQVSPLQLKMSWVRDPLNALGAGPAEEMSLSWDGVLTAPGGVAAGDLVAGRVPVVGASGRLVDDAGLTYETSTDYLYVAGAVAGSAAASGNLQLHSTSHATKGKILFGASAAYDGLNSRFGVGNQTPAYALDVTGQARVTTQLGVGATPNAQRGLNVSLTEGTDNHKYGVLASITNAYAATYSKITHGVYAEAVHGTSQNATDGIALVGVFGRAALTADNATVGGAAGVRSRILTNAAGTDRAFTVGYGYFADVSLFAGGSIGTYFGLYVNPSPGQGSITSSYGLYVVTPNPGATNRWGVYVQDAANYFAGNVGVGVSSTSHKLEVVGGSSSTYGQAVKFVRVTDTQLRQSALVLTHSTTAAKTSGLGSGLVFAHQASDLEEQYSGAIYCTLDSSYLGQFEFVQNPLGSPVSLATITAGGAVQASAAAAPMFAFLTDPDTGMGNPVANSLGFYLGNAEQYRMDTTALYPLSTETLDLGRSTNVFNHLWSVYGHVGRVTSLPSASAAYEGAIVRRAGQTSPPGPDTLHVCISVHPSGPTTYAWKQITLT